MYIYHAHDISKKEPPGNPAIQLARQRLQALGQRGAAGPAAQRWAPVTTSDVWQQMGKPMGNPWEIIEGSLEVKLPTIWTDEKHSRAEAERRERVRRKKMQMREKVGKSRNTVFFQWFVAPEGRKVGSLKRRVRSELARWEMKNCTPLWREAHFKVKMYKPHQVRTTFASWDVEKVHGVVARSTFRSQNVQSTTCSRHFWKFRCRKSARRCGAKHISKSKCTKHDMFAPLLEVHLRGRRKGLCTLSKVSKTWGFCSIFNYNHHYTTLHSNTLHYNYNYNYTFTTFYYTTLHYTTLHSITFNYTTLHYTTLHYTTLHYTEWHCTTDRQVDR